VNGWLIRQRDASVDTQIANVIDYGLKKQTLGEPVWPSGKALGW